MGRRTIEQLEGYSILASFRLFFTSDHILCPGSQVIPVTDKARPSLNNVHCTEALAYGAVWEILVEARRINRLDLEKTDPR